MQQTLIIAYWTRIKPGDGIDFEGGDPEVQACPKYFRFAGMSFTYPLTSGPMGGHGTSEHHHDGLEA